MDTFIPGLLCVYCVRPKYQLWRGLTRRPHCGFTRQSGKGTQSDSLVVSSYLLPDSNSLVRQIFYYIFTQLKAVENLE